MKRIIVVLIAVVCGFSMMGFAQTKEKVKNEKVKFGVEITCQKCVALIEKNLSFAKGVKDLTINSKTQIVEVTYNPTQTDTIQLKNIFMKIGKPAVIMR